MAVNLYYRGQPSKIIEECITNSLDDAATIAVKEFVKKLLDGAPPADVEIEASGFVVYGNGDYPMANLSVTFKIIEPSN